MNAASASCGESSDRRRFRFAGRRALGLASDDDRNRHSGPDERSLMIRFAGMGLELASGIAGCTLIGYGFDYLFGTGTKGVLIGAILGCVGGMYHLIRRAFEIDRALRKIGSKYGNPPGEKPDDESE